MQGDKYARNSHNVMRRFLPLVLRLTSIQIAYKKKITNYLNYPWEQDYHSLVSNIILYMHYEKLQIADTSFKTHEQLQIFKQPDSQKTR